AGIDDPRRGRTLDCGENLAENAPRPVVVRGDGGDSSALSTLLMSQLLPKMNNVAWRGDGVGKGLASSNGSGATTDSAAEATSQDSLDSIPDATELADTAAQRASDAVQ